MMTQVERTLTNAWNDTNKPFMNVSSIHTELYTNAAILLVEWFPN